MQRVTPNEPDALDVASPVPLTILALWPAAIEPQR